MKTIKIIQNENKNIMSLRLVTILYHFGAITEINLLIEYSSQYTNEGFLTLLVEDSKSDKLFNELKNENVIFHIE